MDLSSTFKPEIYRPVVTILIPGGIVIAPFLVGCNHLMENELLLLAKAHSTFSSLALLLGTIAIGFILENLGSQVESRVLDPCLSDDGKSGHYEDWNKYLNTEFVSNPVALEYLETIVLRLKFELAFSWGLFFFAGGFTWLWKLGLIDFNTWRIVLASVILLLGYQVFESYSSAKLLAKVRKNLLTKPIRKI